MSSIDKRIVEMEFQNEGFEKNIKSSENLLKSFDKTLNQTGRTSFSGLNSVIEGVSGKFSALGTIASGALLKIGAEAVSIGTQLAKSLSLDQITAGFGEYELKLNSIKVMLAGGRTAEGLPVTLEMVNEQLELLNQYSDQTIYSFSDMTRNIGKFTNAGVDLVTSVEAIKGISNAAALSGANAEEAARAMYNFAQALSAGYVKLIDWKSIENANMATVEFKTQLMDTAVEMGTLEKTADGMYRVLTDGGMEELISPTKMFNQSLEKQWMTSEVLTGTLSKYSDVTTEIGKKATEAATKVRTFSQLMTTTKEAIGSGWSMTFEHIFGDFDKATELYTGINDTIGALIKQGSKARNDLLEGWEDLGGREDVIAGFSTAWKSLYSITIMIKKAFEHVFPSVTVATLLKLSTGFEKLTKALKPTTTTLAQIHTIFEGFFSILSITFRALGSVLKGVFTGIKHILSLISGGKILGFFANISTFFIKLNNSEKTGKVFEQISKGIGDGISWIADKISWLIQVIKDSPIVLSFVKMLVTVFEFLKKGVQSLYESIKNSTFLTDFINVFKSGLDSLSKIDTSGVSKTGKKIGNIFTSIKKILEPFGKFFVSIFEGLRAALSKPVTAEGFNVFLGSLQAIISGGIGYSIIKFFLSITNLAKGLTGVSGGFKGILTGIQGVLKSYEENLNAKKLVTIATAIAILVGSLAILTLLDPAKMSVAIMIMSSLFIQLATAMIILDKFGGKSSSGKLILIATSILILSVALRAMKEIDSEAINTLTKVLAELVLVSLILSKGGKNITQGTTNLIGMAIAANTLAIVVKIFGAMDPEKLTQGVFAIGALMAEMAVFSVAIGKFGGNAGNILAASVAMGMITIALLELSGVVAILGNFDPNKLLQGLGGLAGIMTLVVTSLVLMADPKILMGAAAMIVMAVAVTMFVPAMALLGKIPAEDIKNGLMAIGAFIAVLVMGGYLLSPVTATLIGVAGAILLLGTASFLAGQGMLLFGSGLAMIAVSGAAAVGVLALAIVSIANLFPSVMKKFGEGLASLATVISDNAPVFMSAFGVLLGSLFLAIYSQMPSYLKTIGDMITLILDFVLVKVPEFASMGLQIATAFILSIAGQIGPLVSAIITLVNNMIMAIALKIPEFAVAALNLLAGFLEGIGQGIQLVVDKGFEIAIKLLNGLATSIEQNMPLVMDAVKNLGTAIIDGLGAFLGISKASEIAGNFLAGLRDGVNNGVKMLLKAVEALGKAVIAAIKKILGIESPSTVMESVGENLDAGLVNGLKKDSKKVIGAANDVGNGAISAMASIGQAISNALDSNINSSPVITPVLDLNGITSGANTLSSLLSTGQTFNLAKAKSADDAAANRLNQNGSSLSQGSVQSVVNQFSLAGAVIRSEEDIDKLADRLLKKQSDVMRSRGLRAGTTY